MKIQKLHYTNWFGEIYREFKDSIYQHCRLPFSSFGQVQIFQRM